MKRVLFPPRNGWQESVESQGLSFHSPDGEAYWDESAHYYFTSAEIDEIEKASYALNDMCLAAVEHVVQGRLFERFGIPAQFHDYLVHSWQVDELTIVGRFDLAYDGNSPPRLLEYNADTPTSLLEAAVIQWNWFQETKQGSDQFNSIHERLIEAFGRLPKSQKIHFTALTDDIEDFTTVTYLRETADQAGMSTAYIDLQTIGWDEVNKIFVDEEAKPIKRCFKLYPWEWMIRESFAGYLHLDSVAWLEAPWKMLLSNKQILVVLSELYPSSPYLLRTGNQPMGAAFAKKPVLSREGANVTLVRDGRILAQSDGAYGEQPCVYQELFTFPEFGGNHALLGSWMVNGWACGMGVREDTSLVTGNRSRFVPHVIE